MSRILAYCAFLEDAQVALPPGGVNGAAVNVLANERLHLLWSEVEWPFRQELLQRNALEFHAVVQHIFSRRAVVPFRLLSVFDTAQELESFAAQHRDGFVADLERLKDFTQMECVVYRIANKDQVTDSGTAYLLQKAEFQRSLSEHVTAVKDAIAAFTGDIRNRQVKNGSRLFGLIRRGQEEHFRRAVEQVALPERLSRRLSGPWPASEFLSDTVKAPQIAGQR